MGIIIVATIDIDSYISLCIVFLCLNNALPISLFVDYSPFLLDYNRIIFLFIVTLDDSIDLTRKQSSVWLHETYAHELLLSSTSSSWKPFDRRRCHSSPILLLSNKFAI